MGYVKDIDPSVYRIGDKVTLLGDEFCQKCGEPIVFIGKAQPLIYDTKTGEPKHAYAEGHFQCPNHRWWNWHYYNDGNNGMG